MKRFSQVGLSALAAAMLIASGASAATITEVLQQQFDPTVQNYYDSGYGHGAALLSWSSFASPHLFDASGHPTGSYAPPDPSFNPSWLNFQTISGSSGGGGSGSGGGTTSSTPFEHNYTLSNNNHQDWKMDFSTLVFDPTYAGTGMLVELMGTDSGPDTYKSVTLTAAQVKAGRMQIGRAHV
jgi:hypothetical protein